MKTKRWLGAVVWCWFVWASGVAGAEIGSAGGQAVGGAAKEAFELRMAGKTGDAAALLKKALAADPKNAAAWLESARLEFYLGEFKQAGASIKSAIELDPGVARYHYWAGAIELYRGVDLHHRPWAMLGMRGAFARAREALEKSVELDVNQHAARIFLISLYANNPKWLGGNRPRAEAHVKTLEELDAVEGARGRCILLKKGERAQAVEIWQEVVEINPSNAKARRGLGDELRRQGRHEEAVAQYERVLELDPADSEVALVLAECHAQNGKPEEARAVYEVYLAARSDAPAAMRARAMRRLANLDPTKAEALRAEAKDLDAREKAPRDVPDLYAAP